MCKTNPITREHIETWKFTLSQRLSKPSLSPEQRMLIQAQLDYIVNNVTEKEGSPGN
ncbi:MAG: hypothetical protein Q7R39_15605 [Dehalococcoidia bacterium]|nr:hypothetical protein [Dehalococcoidia bacterium]